MCIISDSLHQNITTTDFFLKKIQFTVLLFAECHIWDCGMSGFSLISFTQQVTLLVLFHGIKVNLFFITEFLKLHFMDACNLFTQEASEVYHGCYFVWVNE